MPARVPIDNDPAGRIAWTAALLTLGLLAIAYLWFPLVRATSYVQVNHNEGWNAYRQQMAARHLPLYGLPPDLSITDYPPLSFHLVGFVGTLIGDMTAAGRWVSLISLAAIAFLIAALAQHFGGRLRVGIFAALCFVIWVAIYCPDRIGMNDPQLVGTVLSLVGFWIYVRKAGVAWLSVSALAFAVAIFTKHNLLSLPAAVGLDLLMARKGRPLWFWSTSFAACCTVLTLLTLQWEGHYFWTHVFSPRGYFVNGAWTSIFPYLVMFQIPLAIAILWIVFAPANARLLILSFAVAHGIGFVFAGGDGVDRNVLLEGLMLLAIVCALGIGNAAPYVVKFRQRKILLPVLLALPCLSMAAFLPDRLRSDLVWLRLMPDLEAQTSEAIELLKSRPGPALCEDLLLCYEAGKAEIFDAFYVHEQLRLGRVSEAESANLIASRRFRTIEIELRRDEALNAVDRMRFTASQIRALVEHYRPVFRASTFAVLVPRDDP